MRRSRPRRPALAAMAALLVVGAWPASPVRADATIVVDTVQYGLGVGGCSLEEAILAANQDSTIVEYDAGPPIARTDVDTGCVAGAGPDVITLRPGLYTMPRPVRDPGSHLGAAALPIISSVITIEGAGAVLARSADADDDFRLFSVAPTGDLDLREVHVRGFAARGGGGSDGGGGGMGAGGAIFVDDGALRVQWSTFQSNVATGGDGNDIFSPGGGGGGGGGIGGWGSFASLGGGGGGGSRGSGGVSLAHSGAGGGGTLLDGGFAAPTNPFVGGYLCGGAGNDVLSSGSADGFDAYCPGGGGGGGADGILLTGDGGAGAFGGGGGGGAASTGNGGQGGFGGGGGAAGTSDATDGGGGGDGGFGGGGGAGPGGTVFGEPGDGGTFAGRAGDLAGGGGAGLGGAIFGYRANIIVSNSTFTGNAAARGVAGGTGAQNGADAGGAIFTVGGSLTVVNTTLAGNETTGDGAGIAVYQPLSNESTTLALTNAIIAGNTGRDECFVLRGVTTSGGNNLVTPHLDDTRSPCPGIILTDDPELGPLQLNAPGRTPTMALAPTSPAVDAGDPVVAPLDDQRGVSRPQGAGPDLGAYELDGVTQPSDTTAPTAAPTKAPAANGNGWNRFDVTVSWRWVDEPGGSGIDPAACMATSTSAGEGLGLQVIGTCRDLAGNVGRAASTVNVDATAPVVTCSTTPVYTIGGDHGTDVTATVADGLSGPVASLVSADVTAADVAAAGVGSKSLAGQDLAGHQTTVDCSFVVRYAFFGFLEPIPGATVKRGSTLPVRFRLGDASGATIADADAAAMASACLVEVTFDGVVRGCATYDPVSNTFQADIKTARTLAPGAHAVGIRVRVAGGDVVNTDEVTVVVKK